MPPLVPTILGGMLMLASILGLIAAYRHQSTHHQQRSQPMTPEQVETLQANYRANAVQMVHDLNRNLEPEGKHIPERFVFEILDIDPKAAYDQSQDEEGQTDV